MSLSINWSDLLGRETLALPSVTPAATNKRVLITGAGGSIGTALAAHIACSSPANLVLLDTAEHALYTLDRTVTTPHRSVLGSVSDASLLDALFREHRPQIVFHAAAYKHVTIVERNPFAGIANNALGTTVLAQAAFRHDVEQLVLVSTDKAVDPASLMGASKRIAELLLLAAPSSATAVKVVRLANVLGSRGSVVPLFLDQLAKNQPLTVTAPDVQRYFITLDECVSALTQALTYAEPLLSAHAGEPIRVLDLAHFLSRQAEKPGHPIQFIGLATADKRSEQLLGQTESWAWPAWSPQGLRAIHSPAPAYAQIAEGIHELRQAIEQRNMTRLLSTVQTLVPAYQPSSLLSGMFADCGVA